MELFDAKIRKIQENTPKIGKCDKTSGGVCLNIHIEDSDFVYNEELDGNFFLVKWQF